MGVLDPNQDELGPSLGAIIQLVPDLVSADPTTIAVRLREEYGYVVRIPPLHPALDGGVRSRARTTYSASSRSNPRTSARSTYRGPRTSGRSSRTAS